MQFTYDLVSSIAAMFTDLLAEAGKNSVVLGLKDHEGVENEGMIQTIVAGVEDPLVSIDGMYYRGPIVSLPRQPFERISKLDARLNPGAMQVRLSPLTLLTTSDLIEGLKWFDAAMRGDLEEQGYLEALTGFDNLVLQLAAKELTIEDLRPQNQPIDPAPGGEFIDPTLGPEVTNLTAMTHREQQVYATHGTPKTRWVTAVNLHEITHVNGNYEHEYVGDKTFVCHLQYIAGGYKRRVPQYIRDSAGHVVRDVRNTDSSSE